MDINNNTRRRKGVKSLAKTLRKSRGPARAALIKQIRRNINARLHRGQITPERANILARQYLASRSKTMKAANKRKSGKTAKRIAKVLRAEDSPYKALESLRKFLAKSIDSYESDELDDKDVDMLSQIYLEIGAVAQDHFYKYPEHGDPEHPELEDEAFMEAEPFEYIKVFHDYLIDLLRDYKRKPSEDRQEVLKKIASIIKDALKKHIVVANNSNSEMSSVPMVVPSAVEDEFDDLLGALGKMGI